MDAWNAGNALNACKAANAHHAPDAHYARSMVQKNMTTWQMMTNSVANRDLLPNHGGVQTE